MVINKQIPEDPDLAKYEYDKKLREDLSEKLIIILYMQFVRMAYSNSRDYGTIHSLLSEGNEDEVFFMIEDKIDTWKLEMVDFDKLNKDEQNYIRGEARKIINLLDTDK